MAHVSIVEYQDIKQENVKQIYDEIISELGFGMVPNLFKSMATRPGFLHAQWNHFRSTILQGQIPRTLKEMVGVAISQRNDSQYALNVHLHGLSALGMSEEVLQTLVSDFEACPLPQREKAIIRFGLQAATNPEELAEDDFISLRNLGLDDEEIYEILSTANLFAAVNQYTDAIDLEIDEL